MKILVTGGAGYVGTLLTKELLEQGHEVVVYDTMWFGNYLTEHKQLSIVQGDIRDTAKIPLDGVDTIIHLANISNDPCGDLSPKLSWEVNVLASMGLIERAIQHKVKHFLFASSGSVYGVKEEANVTEDLSLVPISEYNKTKMIAERVFWSYREHIPMHMIRPGTVCGYSPRMRLDLAVNILTMQAVTKGKINVFGGTQVRPNIHIQDMIRVYLHFLSKPDLPSGMYNAGFENISILDLASQIKERTSAEITITESNDPRSYRLDASKLLATGFEPKFTVADGVSHVIEAFKTGTLKDEDRYYNIRTMKTLEHVYN